MDYKQQKKGKIKKNKVGLKIIIIWGTPVF